MLVQSNESSCENNNEVNQLKYISTYKMGQIGITKLIEEPYKSSLITENNLSTHHHQIIKIPSNTNSNTNTNNTNSNTNTNTFKAMDNISNKKNLKHNYSSSHNNVMNVQSSSNLNYYKNRKNKSNQRKNKINNDIKQKSEAVKLNKNQFSKTENNLCLYINNNFFNKSKNNNSYKNSYLNKNSKSKSNSKIQFESGYSNYILSSRTPSSIKRNTKKHSMSNLITKEKDEETKKDSFKKDNIFSHYLKTNTSNNLSSIDINQNQKINKDNINLEAKYQLTEFNTYLKVRKRDDIPNQKHSNSNLNIENNKLISSCLLEKDKNEKIFSDKPEKLYLSEVLSTENNIKEKPNIKLILIDKKNTNRLLTENNQNFNNKFNSTFNINIFKKNNLINVSKDTSASKNNIYSNKRKNSSNKDLNKINYGSKTYSQMKNKTNYTKSNLKEKNKDNENLNNFNKKHSNNATKNKNFYKSRKNFSVNNSKKQIIKDKNAKDKKINLRYNSFVNMEYNNNKKKDDKINQDLNQNEKKNIQNYNYEDILNKELKFECPEDLHFFMVNLTHNCRKANSNF